MGTQEIKKKQICNKAMCYDKKWTILKLTGMSVFYLFMYLFIFVSVCTVSRLQAHWFWLVQFIQANRLVKQSNIRNTYCTPEDTVKQKEKAIELMHIYTHISAETRICCWFSQWSLWVVRPDLVFAHSFVTKLFSFLAVYN